MTEQTTSDASRPVDTTIITGDPVADAIRELAKAVREATREFKRSRWGRR